MKTYRFKYSKTVMILCILVILLSISGIIINALNIFSPFRTTITSISAVAMIILSLALLVLIISILVNSKYVLTDKELFCKIGFFKMKMGLDKLIKIISFHKTNKLVCYFSDGKYSVIVISATEYDDFVQTVKERNPQIIFESFSDE